MATKKGGTKTKKSTRQKTKNKQTTPSTLSYTFLFVIMTILLGIVTWMFRPFLIDILLAGVFASFFYPMYSWLRKKIGKKSIASLITTLFIAIVVFVPIINFTVYTVNRSIDAYSQLAPFLQNEQTVNEITTFVLDTLNFVHITPDQLYTALENSGERFNQFLLSVSSALVKGTTSFLISTIIIFLTIYYLFVDGKRLTRRLMNLTPLPNKYDQEIFTTFREVSYSTIVSTFVVAIFQGIVGGIGFIIAGLPGFFAGVLIAIMSILPYIGAVIIWLPAAIYLFLQGDIWQAGVLTAIGVLISNGDNVLRAYLIKGRIHVHELLVFFSLIGGMVLFGLWGVIIGPLLLSLLFTVINIYEKEFADQLEKELED